MTTRVVIEIPEGQGHTVVVRGYGTPTEIAPGQRREFYVWAGQELKIEERDGGGE